MSSSQPLDHWLGRLLGARYRLDRRLGSGGMADVFLATDTLLRQSVALKLLHEKLVTGEFRERFEQEVGLCAALRSAHVVQVSDHGVTSEGYPFYVMEYLEGQNLSQLLKQEKVLSVDRAIRIITQVCTGLHLAHQGFNLCHPGANSSEHVTVIHRDLKPDNIFIVPTALGELVKILDFGIAKIQSDRLRLNATTVFLGTYRYAAPEQFEIGKDLDERADLYSLGIILYEMLSGTDPFGFGDNARHLSGGTWAIAHVSKSLVPLRQQPGCNHISPELEAVVMRCLHKAPHQRFASVSELSVAMQFVPEAAGVVCPSAIWQSSETQLTTSTCFPTAISNSTDLSRGFKTADSTLPAALQNITSASNASATKILPRSAESLDQSKSAFLLTGAALSAAAIAALFLGLYSLQSATSPISPLIDQKLQPPQPIKQKAELTVQRPASSIVRSLIGHSDAVWAIAVSPLGEIVSGSFDKTIKVWNPQTGKLLRTLSGHSDAVRAIAISQDGSLLASGSSDKTIKIWNLQTGKLLRTLSGHRGAIWSVSISPDGKTLVSGAYDGAIKIWNLQTGERLDLPEHDDSIWSVAISPDGQTLVSGAYDGAIKIWNLQTRELLSTLSEGHSEAVRSIAISSDGQTLVSGSWDKTVKVWDLQTGRLLHTLSGHSDRVVSVAISPTDQTIASSSLDRTIKLWDLQTGRSLRTLSGHTDWVLSVAFSADGQALASASKDQTVKVWEVGQ
jgi:eukaryotic-like serine/threonine-protein kinase